MSPTHADRLSPRAHEPAWLWSLRSQAMDAFTAGGFPSSSHEEWKHARLKPLAAADWSPSTSGGHSAADLDQQLEGLPACRVVLVDGVLDSKRSAMAGLPPGVVVSTTQRALTEHPELAQAALTDGASYEGRPFVALNMAFWTDGLLVRIPRGVQLEAPIALVVASSQPGTTAVRNVLVLEEGAAATVVEHYLSLSADARVNAVTEVQTQAGARLEHVALQQHADDALHVAALHLAQHRDSSVSSHVFSLGGAVARTEVRSRLQAPGASCRLRGLAVGRAHQHHDLLTHVEHAMPHGTSDQAFKTILDDHATGVFNGMVLVQPGADGTNALQSNHNLLLSDDADAHARPQLEIHTDDVKCSHGATVGAIDAEALFFLRSRGIPEEAARSILTRAFADTVVTDLPEALRAPVEHALAGALQ